MSCCKGTLNSSTAPHCIPSRRRSEVLLVLEDSPFVCRKARVLLGSVGCSEFDIEERGGRAALSQRQQ